MDNSKYIEEIKDYIEEVKNYIARMKDEIEGSMELLKKKPR